ncbi:bZIP transcription factor [Paenibacillus sp. FSL H3-0457]|uniref:bZIP transcription factor n=1 Tax=Paenibacillus sp. FSL H3-0457 TaxID=2921430 RepID=UPI0030EBA008
MKIVPGILLISAFLTLAACSPQPNADLKSDGVVANEVESTVSQTEPTEESKDEITTDSVNEEQEITATTIKKNDTVTIDGYAELSVSKQKFSKKIEPSKPGNFYTYYESKEEDSTYFALTVKAKNLYTTGIDADEIANVTLIYDNQYDYPTFSTVEEKGGEDFTYSNITSVNPLKTTTLYYLAEIPNEVADSDKPLKALIKVKDNTFEYTIR